MTLQLHEKTGSEFVITLKEITDILQVRHNDAMAKVERLAQQPSFGVLRKTRITSGEHGGRPTDTYELTKKQAIAVGARLNDGLLMKLIDHLERLENQSRAPQLPDFTNPAIAARAWADEVEQKLKALETIKRKDEVIKAVADLNIRAGDVSIADFAKNLSIKGLGQNNIFNWLKARGFLMLNTAPYQQYVERGYFVRKPYEKKINGEVRYRTMLTPKGSVWLARMLKAEFEIGSES